MIRALGDSKTPLVFLAIACVINIILDYTFIVFCGMDTNGVGLATVTAQLISAILCVVYIVKKQPALHINNLHLKWSGSMNKRLLNIGIPMAFLNMVLSVGGIIIQYAANGLGTIYVSAQVTGTKIINFVNLPVLSFGSALSVFCAQNYGAEKYDRVLTGGRKTNLMCIIWWLICLAVMIPFGKFFITLLAGEVEAAVMENAYLLLLFQTIFFIIVIPLILYKSLLQAVCRTFLTMMSGFTEIVGRAGLSIVCVYLIKAQIIDVSTGFIFICLAGPAAWLCGLITVAPDIFKVHRDFKLKIAERKNIQGNTDT